jgi:penicillin-binding protein 1A
MEQKVIRWIWIGVFSFIVGSFLLFFILSFTNLPSVEQLENPKSELATQVFASDGSVLGRFYIENRVPVTYEQLTPFLTKSLIATEDERYFKHSGIDFKATLRVVFKTILLRDSSSGGGSTITQQLAKLLFTGKPGSGLERVVQKFKEWIIAVRLERRFTKEEILAMYLNKVDFLYQGYGIKAAAEIYFGKDQKDLLLEEAAVLVGMLKNPNLYNPVRRPELSKERRNVVFNQLHRNKLLSKASLDSLSNLPLTIQFQTQSHIDGIATYYRMELAKEVKNLLNENGSTYDIYRDGLRIYTTIDPKMQAIAEEEMIKHMKNVQAALAKEWKGLDPWTYKDRSSTTEIPVEVRKQTLDRLIRETSRYQYLRKVYLLEVIEKIEKKLPEINFYDDDRDIIRLMEEVKKRGHIESLVKSNIISEDRADQYNEVLESPNFEELKTAWNTFQKAVKVDFEKKIPMTVFAYNDQMQLDTNMSPMDSIKYMRMFLQTGILVLDPQTGYIKVWVGGVDQKYFQYDHVKSNRQVGSTFKPFIYATAIAQQGFSPCYKVYDVAQTIAPGDGNFGLLQSWTPVNFDGKYTGKLYTLKEGLRQSKNTISVHLMKQLGDAESVRALIHNMGIDSSERLINGRLRIPNSPSICLGATDLTVMEMTGAYTTFANNGIYSKPTHILKIEDKNGKVIYQSIPEDKQALPSNANYVMVEMLKYAATGLSELKSDVGGKTGTTNDFSDGWFMGITPSLVVGTWVGGEDRWIHFRSSALGQGSRMARPFFKNFILRLEQTEGLGYDPLLRFLPPSTSLGIELNCGAYDVYSESEFPEEMYQEQFLEEDLFGDEALVRKKIDSIQINRN